jgi:hypothetical protein
MPICHFGLWQFGNAFSDGFFGRRSIGFNKPPGMVLIQVADSRNSGVNSQFSFLIINVVLNLM